MSTAHPKALRWKKCQDCPVQVPAVGSRKRCLDCAEKAYRIRKAKQNKRQGARQG